MASNFNLYEYNAPQFANFISSDQEDDGADCFFDNPEQPAYEDIQMQAEEAIGIKKEPLAEDDALHLNGDNGEMEQIKNNDIVGEGNGIKKGLTDNLNEDKSRYIRPPNVPSLNSRIKRKWSPTNETRPRKFLSMAERLHKFQYSTPDRFHSKPRTFNGINNVARAKHQDRGPTLAKTPELCSHLRSRKVTYLPREEVEDREMEIIRSQPFKANPLNPNIFKAPKLGVRVAKKEPQTSFKFEPPNQPPKTNMQPSTSNQNFTPIRRRIVQGAITTAENGTRKQETLEIPHFGVYSTGRCTKAMRPFNFDLEKEKLKTVVNPFSFDIKDKERLKKKEERLLAVYEQEKRLREFRANPIPHCLRLDLVLGKENNARNETPVAEASFKAQPAHVLFKSPFRPKLREYRPTEPAHLDLNTERRARAREIFDLQAQEYIAELDAARQKHEKELREQEEAEIIQLRKEMVTKAQPIRHYKPMLAINTKKVTSPRTPLKKL